MINHDTVIMRFYVISDQIHELTTFVFWTAFSLRDSDNRYVSNWTVHATPWTGIALTFCQEDKTRITNEPLGHSPHDKGIYFKV